MIVHADAPKTKPLTVDRSSGEIGDELEFTVRFDLGNGTKNVSLNIYIPKGLTLLVENTEIKNLDSIYYDKPESLLPAQNDYQLYQITFADGIKDANDIEVTCKVKINENAKAGKYEKITCRMTYGDEFNPIASTPQEYSFYTFGFDLIIKKPTEEVLPGASFTLHRTGENNAKYYYTNPSDVNNICEPRFTALQEGTDPTKLTTDENGKIRFSGLKPGSYILTQTATAEGYEVLDPLTITIGDDGTLSATGITVEINNVEDNENKIRIKNPNDPNNKIEVNTYYGTLTLNNNPEILTYIPAAGGVGVTAFYITGGLLMCGAVVLLIINKRKLFGLK